MEKSQPIVPIFSKFQNFNETPRAKAPRETFKQKQGGKNKTKNNETKKNEETTEDFVIDIKDKHTYIHTDTIYYHQ